jgi:multiple sugar transport system substrate-binding protein/sn-glycerol 3-phosphate transport system substrate-binding protein
MSKFAKQMLLAIILIATAALVACGGVTQEQVESAVEQVGPTLEAAATELGPTVEAAAEQIAPTVAAAATEVAEEMAEEPTEEPAEEPTTAPAEEEPTEEAMDEEACAPATEGELAGVDPRGQNIQWWHNHSGSREENMLPMIAEFNETNPCGITVEAINQGSYDDIRDKVNASISAGELPAAIIVGYQNDQAFYQLNEGLADLDVYLNDPTWGLTPEEQADFYPVFFAQSLHPAFDNQRLGFPPNRSIEVLFYNQTWLEELGYSGPPTTPEEFREMACAAAEANGDGTGGYILRDDASAVAAWTYAFGGDILTEDKTGYVYNSPATVEALTFLKGLYDDGCAYFFTEGFPDPEFAARRAIFTQGSSSGIPFYQGGVTTVAEEAGRDPDVWGVAAIPHTTPDPVMNIYGGDIMITANSPEQQLAGWIFIKWFTEPETQARWDAISGYFPTRAGANEFLGDFIAESPYGAQYQQALEFLPYGTYEPQLISYTAVRDLTQQAFNEIMQGADIQSTLDQLTEDTNELEAELMSEVQ